MGNAGDLFKKIRDTKGIFHTKMGSIKDRNMNLKKGEILRKDGKNTKKSYTKKTKKQKTKQNLMTQIKTMV